MAKEIIDIGFNANDGTGDDLRTAMVKINNNFTELYGSTAEANDLVEDITPQLGGNLDVQNFTINTSLTNGDITLTPNGTGSVLLDALKINGTTISSDDSTKITLAENVDVTGTLQAPTLDVSIIRNTTSTEISIEDVVKIPTIRTNVISSDDSTAIQIEDGVNISGTLTVGGAVIPSAYSLPSALGTNGHVLKIDGGNLVFGAVSGAGIEFSADDSTATAVAGGVLQVKGGTGISTTITGDILTITGVNQAQGIVFSADDSAGITIEDGGQLYIQGGTNITTSANSDGTITITGPDTSSFITASSTDTLTNKSGNISMFTNDSGYLTSSSIIFGDSSSTTTTVSNGGSVEVAGTGGITTTVSDGKITIDGSGLLSSTSIIFGDSTSSTITANNGDSIDIFGTGGITATVADGKITIDGSGIANVSDVGGLKVDGTTITPAASNADININTNGTGVLNLDGAYVRVGGVYDSIFSDSTVRRGYEYGVSSLTEHTFDLTKDSLTSKVFGNSFTGFVELTGIEGDDAALDAIGNNNNEWSAARVELITDYDNRAVRRTDVVTDGAGTIRSFGGGATAFQIINQSRNTNIDSVTVEQAISETSSVYAKFVYNTNSGQTDIITDNAANYRSLFQGNIDSGSTTTNEFIHYHVVGSAAGDSGATTTLTDEYGLYMSTNSTATNTYGVYIASDDYTNRLGGIQLKSGNISVTESNQNINIDANGSGSVVLSGLSFPNSDGTSGQIIQTDGSGNLSFVDVNTDPITFVGDDSAGVAIDNGGQLYIQGGNNITTSTNSDGTLTITGSTDINVNNISSTDSSAVQINDGLNVSGAVVANAGLTAGNITTNEISSSDSTAVQVNDGLNISGTLSANTIDTNTISSGDSSQILVDDNIKVSGTLTANAVVTESISPPDSISGTYQISSPTSITLAPTDETLNTAPHTLWSRTVAQLTASPGLTASAGAMVYCTDDVGGAVPAFFDGTSWRRITDRAVVTT